MRATLPIVASFLPAVLFHHILSPVALAAQAVSGIVAAVETEVRIQGAEVELVDAAGVSHPGVRSGENGEFFLEAPGPGTYDLRVRQIGFKPASTRIVLQSNQVLEIQLGLAPQATRLEGITVLGQIAETPGQREFLSRRHIPWNHSYNMREIERFRQGSLDRVLAYSIPMVPSCRLVYIDGLYSHQFIGGLGVRDGALSWQTQTVYGLEVYRTWFDIPLKYREVVLPDGTIPSQRCGAILIWTTTPPGYGAGIPNVWSGALGWGVGWERGLIDIGWRRDITVGVITVAHVRIGRYSPIDLVRSAASENGPFDPNQYPVFVSTYVGKQWPIPVAHSQQMVYSRVAFGASFYWGQSLAIGYGADSTVIHYPASPLYVGLGGLVALGISYPRGSIRPILEVRTGSEWVMSAGLRWAKPVFMAGIEIGGRR